MNERVTMRPTVGRIVHYQSLGSADGAYLPSPRAAIVTAVAGKSVRGRWLVDLCVLNPEGMYFNRGVAEAEEPTPGFWNWPPRVTV